MRHSIQSILLLLLFVFTDASITLGNHHAGFIKVENGRFSMDGKPYYYIGTNFWYGAILGSKGTDGDRVRLIKELNFMKNAGINNLRIMVGAEGPEDHEFRVQPSLQSEPGKYNLELLDGLDFLLAEMGKRNMKAVLVLNNSWDWSGGYGQYLEWNGYGESPCVIDKSVSWNDYQAFNGRFNTCEQCIGQFHNHIRFILNRTNRYTQQKYISDPAIMAWEVGNEPRAFGNQFIPAFEKMMNETAALIKSIDINHLVTTGTEGKIGCEGSIELFERIHSTPDIDYLTFHIWPLNWGWINKNDIASTIDKSIENTNNYIGEHIKVAEKLNKPIVLEEFGLPRDHYDFKPGNLSLLRDRYFENIFNKLIISVEQNGVFSGANFWSWGGFGRPTQTWYKRGDDYLGDPPCEEQGVNSVYNTDNTIKLIKTYNKKINNLVH